jgi:hypothetical protein
VWLDAFWKKLCLKIVGTLFAKIISVLRNIQKCIQIMSDKDKHGTLFFTTGEILPKPVTLDHRRKMANCHSWQLGIRFGEYEQPKFQNSTNKRLFRSSDTIGATKNNKKMVLPHFIKRHFVEPQFVEPQFVELLKMDTLSNPSLLNLFFVKLK